MLNLLKNRISDGAAIAQRLLENQIEKIKLPEDIRNERYDECKKCQHFLAITTSCTKCGCFMATKTYLPNATCPINKWVAIELSTTTSNI